MTLTVKWLDHGREPVCKPDPKFPKGVDVDLSLGSKRTCETALPYPAKRIGLYLVVCDICGLRVGVTTAGRPDDPRSLKIACELVGGSNGH
jgi:hypothetical protein